QAIPEFQKAVELNNDPFSIGMLVQAYVRNGQPEEARKTLAHLNEVMPSGDRPAYALALAHASLGDKTRAIEELEQAYNGGNRSYLFIIKVDPLLDDLRGDPRFEALVQKVTRGK